ncbi:MULTISPECIES: hypothetical protein [Streptomyces]|uniref:hypothetical protein n=1 Tax=Streptomyces TaxID=1883 RepID=UPI0004C968B0|nr:MULTISPECIES: hypothetical protein [Streptomyces]MDX3608932.1 hypothetical protein [Streptomyces sp. FL06-04B]MDX3739633.1 hypothetical protein [Streptomyces sp. ID01-15D]
MPEQLFAPSAAEAEHDDQEQGTGSPEAIDMTALRALRKLRTDVEAPDVTAGRLRLLQDVFAKAADDSRTRMRRRTNPGDGAANPVRREDKQAHPSQQPGPHRGR